VRDYLNIPSYPEGGLKPKAIHTKNKKKKKKKNLFIYLLIIIFNFKNKKKKKKKKFIYLIIHNNFQLLKCKLMKCNIIIIRHLAKCNSPFYNYNRKLLYTKQCNYDVTY